MPQKRGFEMRILSLCSGSGSFEKPWLDNGRYVLSLTLPFEDVRLIKFEPKGFDGILCAPPCRCFTQTASSMPNSITEKIDAISVVDACLRAVLLYRPKFWVLENPPGSLKDYIGPCSFSFQPWWYGDLSQKYTKETVAIKTVKDPNLKVLKLVQVLVLALLKYKVTFLGFLINIPSFEKKFLYLKKNRKCF